MNIYFLLSFRFLKAVRRGVLSFLSLFSIVGITLGVSSLIIVIGIMSGFKKEIENRLLRFIPHISIIPLNQNLKFEEIKEKIKLKDGVKDVKEYIILKTIVKASDKMDGVLLKAVDNLYSDMRKTIISGSDDIKNGVLIGKGLAQKLNVVDGDTIEVYSVSNFVPYKLKISGIVDAGIYDINEHFIMTSIENIRKLGNFPISGIEVYLNEPNEAQKLSDDLRRHFENVSIFTWIDLNRNLFSALELEKLGMFIVLLLITIVASFNIISTLFILSEQKSYDIAILRVFGFKSKDVIIVFLIIGSIIGLMGILGGILLGFIISFLITGLKIIRLRPEIYFIDYIPIKSTLLDYLIISFFAFLIVFLFSIIPSLRISKLKIRDVLK